MTRAKTLILHVEDDVSQQSLVRITLERAGAYRVCSAGDGDQALDLARAQAPQLLLLDLDLPGMDGIAALRGLRELEGLRDVPAVFLTAAGPERMDEELRTLGVREVLGKPFSPRVLLRTIDRVLADPPR